MRSPRYLDFAGDRRWRRLRNDLAEAVGVRSRGPQHRHIVLVFQPTATPKNRRYARDGFGPGFREWAVQLHRGTTQPAALSHWPNPRSAPWRLRGNLSQAVSG